MKKSGKIKFISLLLAVCLVTALFAVPALAASVSRQVTVHYRDIKVSINGKTKDLYSSGGTPIEPFLIDGTTYLPIRAIAESLGLNVSWDGGTNTVVLTTQENPAEDPLSGQFTLAAGQYVVGEDIAAGKYDCIATAGSGNFHGNVTALGGKNALNEILGTPGTPFEDRQTYSNLRLADGDVITLSGNLKVKFTAE